MHRELKTARGKSIHPYITRCCNTEHIYIHLPDRMSSDRDGRYNARDDSFDYRRRNFSSRRGIDRGGRAFYSSSRGRGSWDYRGGFQYKNTYPDRRFESRSRKDDFQKSGDLINRSGDLIGPPRHWSKSQTPPPSQVKEKTPPSKVHGYKMMATQGMAKAPGTTESDVKREKPNDSTTIKQSAEFAEALPMEQHRSEVGQSGLAYSSQSSRPLSSTSEPSKAHSASPSILPEESWVEGEMHLKGSRSLSQEPPVKQVAVASFEVSPEKTSQMQKPSSGPPMAPSVEVSRTTLDESSGEFEKELLSDSAREPTRNPSLPPEMVMDATKNLSEPSTASKVEQKINNRPNSRSMSETPPIKSEPNLDAGIRSNYPEDNEQRLAPSWSFPLTRLETKLFALKQIPKSVLKKQLPYSTISSPPPVALDDPMIKQQLGVLGSQECQFVKYKNFEYHIRLISWRKMCRQMENDLCQLDPSMEKESSEKDADSDPKNKRRRHGDSVRTEAEFLEILANLERENEKKDPLYKAEKLAAKIPEMITNPLERDSYMYLDCNNLIGDKGQWCKQRFKEVDNFTQKEHDAFCEFFSLHPKKFGRISALMGGLRTRGDCVNHYYRTKKTTNYKQLVATKSKRKLKRKMKSEAPSEDETEEEYNASGRRKKLPMELDKRKKVKSEEEEAANKSMGSPSSYWSVPEMSKFPELLKLYGSDFQAIANNLGSKTSTMVKNFYLKKAREHGWYELVRISDEKQSARSTRPPPTSIMSLLNE